MPELGLRGSCAQATESRKLAKRPHNPIQGAVRVRCRESLRICDFRFATQDAAAMRARLRAPVATASRNASSVFQWPRQRGRCAGNEEHGLPFEGSLSDQQDDILRRAPPSSGAGWCSRFGAASGMANGLCPARWYLTAHMPGPVFSPSTFASGAIRAAPPPFERICANLWQQRHARCHALTSSTCPTKCSSMPRIPRRPGLS
jgi:hypothetical protein